MNNGMDYNYSRRSWTMKHPPPPPPKRRIYGNATLKLMELRGSWLFKHPPPQTIGMESHYTDILKKLRCSGQSKPTLKKLIRNE